MPRFSLVIAYYPMNRLTRCYQYNALVDLLRIRRMTFQHLAHFLEILGHRLRETLPADTLLHAAAESCHLICEQLSRACFLAVISTCSH